MKKTLVALAVMAFAGSANAAFNLYDKDGVTVDLKGDMEVRYQKDAAKGSELTQNIHDADFALDIRYAYADDLKIGGFFEVQDTGTNAGDAYVALYTTEMGNLYVGRMATILDDSGIGNDYVYGIKSKVDAFDFSGTEVIKYQLDKGQFYGGFAVLQNNTGQNKKLLKDSGKHFDANIGARFGDLDAQVFYGQSQDVANKDTAALVAKKQKVTLFQVAYTIDAVKLEALYSQGKLDSAKTDTLGVAATYTMDAWTFGAGYSNASPKGGEDVANAFVNAGYALTKGVTTFVELGYEDEKGKDNDLAYAFGIKATF
ncbi:porin [Vibrio vulnificus]|uniref:porin n=1 Tax=Vibrio vulnificus TaxID=672 RepID=UPI003ED8F9FB